MTMHNHSKDENLCLSNVEAGSWLKKRRCELGISARASRANMEYYTFISLNRGW